MEVCLRSSTEQMPKEISPMTPRFALFLVTTARSRSSGVRVSLLLSAIALVAASSARAQIKLEVLHGTPNELLGSDTSPIGDVNGDGIADFVAGAPSYNNSSGEAVVYSGRDGSVLFHLYGSGPNDEFGGSVSGAGDVNGDGIPDIIVGSTYMSASDTTGNAVIFSGADGSILRTLIGATNSNFIVSPVAGVGDVNGDGYDDVIVGEPYFNNTQGRIRVYSGFDGSILYEKLGATGERLGLSVAAAGDVDNDGTPDFVVGTDDFFLPGSVYVYSGADGHLLHHFSSATTLDGFGESVAGVGDVDGDGYADIGVGSPQDATGGAAAGAAFVFSGRDGSQLFAFHGTLALARVGKRIRPGGDYDGDGHADFLVAQETDFFVPAGTGSVYLYSGLDGHALKRLASEAPNDAFGSTGGSVLGDVNGDGKLDYLVGGYLGDATTHGGSVYVLDLEGVYSNYCTSSPNSSGGPALIHASGYATFSNDDLVVSATQLAHNTSALLIMSNTQGSTPLGNGTLCLGGHIFRLYPALPSGASGTVSRSVSIHTSPENFLIHPGDTWSFQYWFRDTHAVGAGTNLTDGLQVTFMP
jgi:hypothetical protein